MRYDVTFPSSVSLATGWVSIVKVNPGSDCIFAWLNTQSGDSRFGYNQYGASINYVTSFQDLSFCLTGSTSSVPLSNWALAIGLLLISGFIVVRYRMKRA